VNPEATLHLRVAHPQMIARPLKTRKKEKKAKRKKIKSL